MAFLSLFEGNRERVTAMIESNDSIPFDTEKIYLGGTEHHVRTHWGSLSVIVYGDQDKPMLITYTDLAFNHVSYFQGLFFCPEAASLLLHNFRIYHISPHGHELGAAPICASASSHCVDDLADQILEVLNFFGLGAVMCMGVTAGAYILTLFAMKYRECVLGLILISPLCRTPSWAEWFYNKEVRGNAEVPESGIVQACRSLLDESHGSNVMQFLLAINRRPDLTTGLKRFRCRTLIFVGDNSPFHSEAFYMTSKLDRRFNALVEGLVLDLPEGEGQNFIYLGDGRVTALFKAEVHEWSNGEELEKILLLFINTISTEQSISGSNSSSQTNSSDCKLHMSMS